MKELSSSFLGIHTNNWDAKKSFGIGIFNPIKRFELHTTQQNIVFQYYYQSYCDYLLKMGCIDEEQAVLEDYL